jgi:hypothetical protein
LLGYLDSRTGEATFASRDLLEESIKEVPLVLTEVPSGRVAASCKSLDAEDTVWTVDCPLFRSAETRIRETAKNVSLRSIAKAIGIEIDLPVECVLCNVSPYSMANQLVFSDREIAEIVVRSDQRRLDLKWRKTSHPTKWINLPTILGGALACNRASRSLIGSARSRQRKYFHCSHPTGVSGSHE